MKNVYLVVVMVVSSLLLSACNINVERNDDGSVTATTNISAEEMDQAREELGQVIESVMSSDEAQVESVTVQDAVMGQKQTGTELLNNQGEPMQGPESAPPPQPGNGPAPQGAMPPPGGGQ